MSLSHVLLTRPVLHSALTHALSTENEEIMGLVLGNTHTLENGSKFACIWALNVLIRSDKKPDRVEISPLQLSQALSFADEIGQNCRVIGWYHSHPKSITVFPSHIDIKTQYQYQAMDLSFIGLIFSVFNDFRSSTSTGIDLDIIAFQSLQVPDPDDPSIKHLQYIRVPVTILDSPSDIPSLYRPPPAPFKGTYQCISQYIDNIFHEEQNSFKEALRKRSDPVHTANCSATYITAMTHLMETTLIPTLCNFQRLLKRDFLTLSSHSHNHTDTTNTTNTYSSTSS